MSNKEFFSLSDIYVAYRKAKADAFYETTHYYALAFTEYEQRLHANLVRLQRRLRDPDQSWASDRSFIGDYAYLPKSIQAPPEDEEAGHFKALDPLQDWRRRFENSHTRAKASFRLVICATVDFQIVSALWILKVGYLFDDAIDRDLSFGNRLRVEIAGYDDAELPIRRPNLRTTGLFSPYFSAYQRWRENGLSAMEQALKHGQEIIAMTLDIEQFYHRISPQFLLRDSFLSAVGVSLNEAQKEFTDHLLEAVNAWYRATPDFKLRPKGALPVGLSASKILANVLLADFDHFLVGRVRPLYYGRYVDDIFLVFENPSNLRTTSDVVGSLAERMHPYFRVQQEGKGKPPSLRLHLPYATDSQLIFRGSKQKIFSLSSIHGLDLVDHIREQIRLQSSEYRLLPSVPETGIEMAAKALLATPDATLQADALRKADVVSVRRLGLSLLLSDIEVYAADLQPKSWRPIRKEFYGLVRRHVVTPTGFFDFSGYIPRVFGLMVVCQDVDEADMFISQFLEVAKLVRDTSTAGEKTERRKFDLCLRQYSAALTQAALRSATERTAKVDERLLAILRRLRELDPDAWVPGTLSSLKNRVKQVLLADWGRRPYKDYWFLDQITDEIGPSVPRAIEIRRNLRLGGIRKFRRLSENLKVPYWPALAFPTRPLKFDEISLVAPKVLSDPELFKQMVLVIRGAKVISPHPLTILAGGDDPKDPSRFLVPGARKGDIVVAVTSYATTDRQWELAAKGRPDRSSARFTELNQLINKILREKQRPSYIVFPELSIPRRWALRIARKLASTGVSFVAGLEYYRHRLTGTLRNDCLVSLVTRWPGYLSHVSYLQPKFAAAHAEKANLRALGLGSLGRLYLPPPEQCKPVIYQHDGYCFAILICSDLTNISHRDALRGEIDTLFVLEWNKDIRTFSSLVEATASDLHAYIAQVNNRRYGDSRLRSPAKEEFNRDVVQVKGGCSDFYVLGKIDYFQLRREQRSKIAGPNFKPLPIGYRMSIQRRLGK